MIKRYITGFCWSLSGMLTFGGLGCVGGDVLAWGEMVAYCMGFHTYTVKNKAKSVII